MASTTQAWKGQGTQFQISSLAAGSTNANFTTVAECRTTNYTNRAEQLDASNHDTEGAYRERIPGFKDFMVNFGGNFLPHIANHQALQTLYDSSEKREMRFVWPQVTPAMKMTWLGSIAEYSATFDAGVIASFTGQSLAASAPVFAQYT